VITAVLQDNIHQTLEICSRAGNERYLLQSGDGYRTLSELCQVDNAVFARSDMTGLIDELNVLRQGLNPADQEHVDEIIRLAMRCRDEDGLILAFTPFL